MKPSLLIVSIVRLLVHCFLLLMIGPRFVQADPPLTVLHNFTGDPDGSGPFYSLTRGRNGNLYGVAGGGYGNGTIFYITPSGSLKIIYRFHGLDGAGPNELILGSDGNFYGTTESGGRYGQGTIFKMTPSGSLVTLYDFGTTKKDGVNPFSGLFETPDGSLYGMTLHGGAFPGNDGQGLGTIFRLFHSGLYASLHSFSSKDSDGSFPFDSFIQGKDGDLYATAQSGGINSDGIVFKMTDSGIFKTLHNFNKSDGIEPASNLLLGTDGMFYGTTVVGGEIGNGTVFKMSSSGSLTTLYNFGEGAWPYAGLVQGPDGNLYGTTSGGNAPYLYGTIFQITPSGVLTTIHSFTGNGGAYPFGGLVFGLDYNLYGTTAAGGPSDQGTLFKLTMTPILTSFSPSSGPVGTSITLTGVNFAEAATASLGSVLINFKINSDSTLTLIVPSDAKSGKITIANPFGQTISSVAFKVTR
jgi:uncharacterized repeat protein (TIGR03803 family)